MNDQPGHAREPTGVPWPVADRETAEMAVVAVGQTTWPCQAKRAARRDSTTLQSLAFLVPGAVLLLAIVVWPTIATVRYSFYNGTATKAVGLSNYKSLFSTADTLIAFRNNVIWVLVFPFVVTVIGLVFAVLSERIRWATAFKTVIFLPIVFSVTASSLVFTQIFQLDPHVGVINAIVQTVEDWFNPPGAYPLSAGQTAASLATSGVVAGPHGTLESSAAVRAGGTVRDGPDRRQSRHAHGAGSSPGPHAHPVRGGGHRLGLAGLLASRTRATSRACYPDEDGFPNLQVSLAPQRWQHRCDHDNRRLRPVPFLQRRRRDLPRPDPGVQLHSRASRVPSGSARSR